MATVKSLEYFISGQGDASSVVGASGTTTRILRWEIEIPAGEGGTTLALRIAGGTLSGSVDTGELTALLSQDATAYTDTFGNSVTTGYLAKVPVEKSTSAFGFEYDYTCSIQYNFAPGIYYVFFVPSTTSVGVSYAHKGYSRMELSGTLTYTITFDGNGTTVEPSTQIVSRGGSVMLPTPTRPGYSFMGWSEDANATSGIMGEYTPTASITLYAIWGASGGFIYYNYDGAPLKCEVYYNNSGMATRCDIYYNNNGMAIKI